MKKADERIVHWCVDSSGKETCHLNGRGSWSETLLGGITLSNVSGTFLWYGWTEDLMDFPRRSNSYLARKDVERALNARGLTTDD